MFTATWRNANIFTGYDHGVFLNAESSGLLHKEAQVEDGQSSPSGGGNTTLRADQGLSHGFFFCL